MAGTTTSRTSSSFPNLGTTGTWSGRPSNLFPTRPCRRATSILEAVSERDRILHFPYQSYDYVIRFLEEAARDPNTSRIWITLYRVAKDSPVVQALIEAARRGVEVTAFVEVKARFDEARNLKWAGEMEEAGVRSLLQQARDQGPRQDRPGDQRGGRRVDGTSPTWEPGTSMRPRPGSMPITRSSPPILG